MGKIAVPPLHLVQGCVHDGKEALPGVMITPLGSSSGTVTDANGNFKLYLPLSATQFTVSFIGYSTQVVAVNPDEKTVYNVDLHENTMMLGDVVIVKHSLAKRVYYRYIKKPYIKLFK